ncbi:isoprenylcysteine carboxyl methyltransferase family protein [Halalkalibacter nanhaiisediminis]|uniref:Methyltransferase n=1 Tax=Halalkalibacter nanhaiisediminis TaxID=688079 RepID=A0A562QH30_9BACI|nr:isoprenylcysteine carboxyl methyltransferase family protein [Halalkalibacter nanhaiisediminis]TWI56039.1 methyltransferase [Halalkalibacter nanhaiisediminis]
MIGIYLFILLVIVQRLIEVVIAKRNARWIKSQGGYETGSEHYRLMIATHVFFFLSLIIEVTLKEYSFAGWSLIPLTVFLLAQIARVWALSSLGRFWNTRIMILPGAKVIAKGPYRFVRHPNYVVVITEIAMLPLIFQAYWTAIVFTIINALVLSIRIKEEEAALNKATDYRNVFAKRSRFMPKYEE